MKFQSYVLMAFQKLFRSWKAKLHEHYNQYSSDEDRRRNKPEGIDEDEWQWLVQHFSSDKFKVS